MGKLCWSLAVFLTVCFGLGQAAHHPFQDYLHCFHTVVNLTPSNACSNIVSAVECLQVLKYDDAVTDCPPAQEIEACTLVGMGYYMTDIHKNMTGMCRFINVLDTCYEEQCKPGGDHFMKLEHDVLPSTENSCSRRAATECLSTISTVSDVNKESCIAVAAAKNCYRAQLDVCDRKAESSVSRMGRDILLHRLMGHVSLCQDLGFPFSADGGLCVPNPVDIFDTEEIKEKLDLTADELCPFVEKYGTKMERYLEECNPTEYNKKLVLKLLDTVYWDRANCMEAGYNNPECFCPTETANEVLEESHEYKHFIAENLCVEHPVLHLFRHRFLEDFNIFNPESEVVTLDVVSAHSCRLLKTVDIAVEKFSGNCLGRGLDPDPDNSVFTTNRKLNGPRIQCMKAGYNLPRDCGCSQEK